MKPDEVKNFMRRAIGETNKELGESVGRAVINLLGSRTKNTSINIAKSSISATPFWSQTSMTLQVGSDAEEYGIYSSEDLGMLAKEQIEDIIENIDSDDLVGIPWADVKRQ